MKLVGLASYLHVVCRLQMAFLNGTPRTKADFVCTLPPEYSSLGILELNQFLPFIAIIRIFLSSLNIKRARIYNVSNRGFVNTIL